MYPIPLDESARLQFLSSCALNVTPTVRGFDEITGLAADLYHVPISLVTLIGEHEQWVHGRTGLVIDCSPRSTSFCAYAINGDDPFIVQDTLDDDRFRNNPFVLGDPNIRFYAGAPIITADGIHLGAVCIIDRVARPDFKTEDARALVHLARMTADRLETKRHDIEGRAVGGFAEATALAILTGTSDGIITSWNAAAEGMFGFSREEAIGRPMDIIIPARFQEGHQRSLAHVARGGETKLVGKTAEVVARRADGSEFPIEISISAWSTNAGMAFGAHMQDISARKKREGLLEHTAAHDQLTGLLNPNALKQELRRRIAAGQPTGVLVFDLDGFKAVNDSLGHSVGDTLLQALAVRLLAIAEPDWTIGRLGGDEFAILSAPRADLFAIRDAAKSILDIFGKVFHVANHRLHLTASIGVALFPDHGEDADEILMRADLAMFRAKRDGGRSYRLFDASMRAELAARHAFKEELRQAQIICQWELHYQPQVSLADGKLIGVEALLRWRHPQWGLLMPSTFMPVLETHLVAYEVGQWVLNESCRQLASWRKEGKYVPRISCNLFAAQVHNRHLVEQVEEALSLHSLDPSDLELELTETIALRHDDDSLRPLFELMERGVGIALDDFGTGFASLSTLKRVPLTRLKIDRSFVSDIATDNHSAAVIDGIIAIGRSLQIDVIAEGVETTDQRDRLQALGCLHGQGYLYGRPVESERIASLTDHADIVAVTGRFGPTPKRKRTN